MMLKKIVLSMILASGFSVLSFSQNQQKIDSLVQLTYSSPKDTNLVNTYEKITRLYLRIQIDSAKVYAQKMIDLSKQLNYNKGLAMGHNWYGESLLWQGEKEKALEHFRITNKLFAKKGKSTLWAKSLEVIANAYLMKEDFDSAEIFYTEALKYHESRHDELSAANVKLNLGLMYDHKGDYTSALKYYYDARFTFNKLENEDESIQTEKLIGVIYGRQHKNDSAISIFNRAIKYYINTGDYFKLAQSYTNLGVIYEAKKMFNKALEAQKRSLEYRTKVHDIYGMGITKMNIGSLYMNMEQYDSVLTYFDSSRAILKKYKAWHPLTYNLLLTGNYYFKTNQLNKAEKTYLKTSDISLKNNLLTNARDASEALILVYEKKQDYKKAFEYAKLYQQQNDSIVNEANIREQTIAKEEYKRKVQLLEKEKEISVEKHQKYYAIVIAVLVFLGFIVLIIYRRKLQKTKLLHMEQQHVVQIQEASLKIQREERKRVANILHDNLAHLIQNSQQKLNNTLADIKEEKLKQKLLQVEDNLVFMNKLAKVASYELEFSFVLEKNLVDQFVRYIGRIEHSHTPKINFNYSNKDDFDLLTNEIKINLFSVFQEMLGNAVKYAKADSITVSLYYDNGKTTLQVTDDGIGFNYDEVRHGQGFTNMKKRAEKLNGTFSFESEPGFGTKLNFVV